MKEIKKEGLKIFSKSNYKNLLLILLIQTTINLFLMLLTILVFINIFTSSFNINRRIFSCLVTILLVISYFSFLPFKFGVYLWLVNAKKNSSMSLCTVFHYYENLKNFTKTILFEITLKAYYFIKFIIYIVFSIFILAFMCSFINKCPENFQIILRFLILISTIFVIKNLYNLFRGSIKQTIARFIFVIEDFDSIFLPISSANFLYHSNKKFINKLLNSYYYNSIFVLTIIFIPIVLIYLKSCTCELTKKIMYKQNQGIKFIPLNKKVISIN